MIAVAAAAAAVYGIIQADDAKNENEQGNRDVNSLRADFEVFKDQTSQRLDSVENDVETAADAQTLSKVQDDLAALEKRVKGLDQGGDTDQLTTRLDDLEQRVDDLEQKSK